MTQKDLFRISHENGVVELRLNRGPVNALSAEFLIDFADLIHPVRSDSDRNFSEIELPNRADVRLVGMS